MSEKKWLSSGFQKARPSGAVDRERGMIEGVSVVTEGEAKGHGVNLDSEFVETVVQQGNAKKAGLKARFGHPNMCSTALGTFIGRFKNFRSETVTRDDGSKALRAVADLFMSTEAKETPNGNLYDYVLGMAEKEPDMFGTSIVFTGGRYYRKTSTGQKVYRQYQKDEAGEYLHTSEGKIAFRWVDEKGKEVDPAKTEIIERDFVECAELHGCDAVDDPAANDGMFSRFSQESVAGQITEFLDLHPQVFEAVSANPDIIKALAKYGDRFDEFLNRYTVYRKDHAMSETANPKPEALNAAPTKPEVAPVGAEPKAPATEGKPESLAAGKQEPKPEVAPKAEATPAPVETPEQLARKEFGRMVKDFGTAIASEVFAAGGTYADAKDKHFAAIQKENAALKEKLAAGPAGSQQPASVKCGTEAKGKTLRDICEKGTRK